MYYKLNFSHVVFRIEYERITKNVQPINFHYQYPNSPPYLDFQISLPSPRVDLDFGITKTVAI